MSVLKEDTIPKAYYSLKEVADILEVKKVTLRFWLHKFYPTMQMLRGVKGNSIAGTKTTIKIPAGFVDRIKLLYMLLVVEQYTHKGAERQLNIMNVEREKELIDEFNKRKLL